MGQSIAPTCFVNGCVNAPPDVYLDSLSRTKDPTTLKVTPKTAAPCTSTICSANFDFSNNNIGGAANINPTVAQGCIVNNNGSNAGTSNSGSASSGSSSNSTTQTSKPVTPTIPPTTTPTTPSTAPTTHSTTTPSTKSSGSAPITVIQEVEQPFYLKTGFYVAVIIGIIILAIIGYFVFATNTKAKVIMNRNMNQPRFNVMQYPHPQGAWPPARVQ